MTLARRQIKQLRAMSHQLQPLLQIGKNDITDAVVKQADEILEQRELMKCALQYGSDLEAREAADILCERLQAQVVMIIGNRFVLYRRSHRDDIEHIRLVAA